MGASAEVSHLDYGNFVVSKNDGSETNILTNIEGIQFDDKTVSLEIDPPGLTDGVFKNTAGVDNFTGTFWEEVIELSSDVSNQGNVYLFGSEGEYTDGHGNTDTFSSVEGFLGTDGNDFLIGRYQ